MTSEKAIQLLHRLQDEQFDGIHGDERREALDMAVRALVEPNIGEKTMDCIIKRLDGEDIAQPTQTNADSTQTNALDCVSRQAAIDAVVSAMIDGADAELVEGIMELLPSAQPQRKSAYLIDPNPYGKCSNCGQLIDIRDGYNYCPNCGARMDGESE